MAAIDAGVVFLPRFTTLVGAADFATAPLDVSRQGGVQFQVWRGPIRTSSGTGEFNVVLEESLDAQTWALGPSTAQAFTILEGVTHFFAYSFRLRWFRVKFTVAGTNPMVSCWAEGLLRGGDGGAWGTPGPTIGTPAGALGYDPVTGGTFSRTAEPYDPWEKLRWAMGFRNDPNSAWISNQIPELTRQAQQDAARYRAENPGAIVVPPPSPFVPGVGGESPFGRALDSWDAFWGK